jgi:hypothetical protein
MSWSRMILGSRVKRAMLCKNVKFLSDFDRFSSSSGGRANAWWMYGKMKSSITRMPRWYENFGMIASNGLQAVNQCSRTVIAGVRTLGW